MKASILFLINVISFSLSTPAQDGSDIRYLNIDNLDTSYIGKTVHLDFYNRSFVSRTRDTITIMVDNKPVVFLEHREDNGYNNWFSHQYFEEIANNATNRLRIIKSVIREINPDSILVTSYFTLYNKDHHVIDGKSFTQDIWVKKNILSQILLHSER